MSENDSHDTVCKICCKPIEPAAKKCTQCNSYQSFFGRYLGFSSHVLALLVALVSVLGFVIPIVADALQRDRVQVVGSLMSSKSLATADDGQHRLELSFVLFNDGNVSFVVSPRMQFRWETPKIGMAGTLELKDEDSDASGLILGPGESRILRFTLATDEEIEIDKLDTRRSSSTKQLKTILDPGTDEIVFDFFLESRIGRRKLQMKYGMRVLEPGPQPPLPWPPSVEQN